MEKWALVTGAAVRVGRECALHLARCGYNLFLHYRNSQIEAAALANEIRSLGAAARCFRCDLEQPNAVTKLWNAAADLPLTVAVNNAALFIPDSPLSPDAVTARRLLAVNYEAPLELMRRVENNLNGATVINFLDGRLEYSQKRFYSYGLSKRMLEWATVGFAAASEKNRYFGIAATALLPPVIDGAVPDVEKSYRFSGCEVLAPILDRILSGETETGTVFTV